MSKPLNRPVRWGILGTALIATKVGNAIKQATGAELVAVASRDLARALQWGARHGVPRAYGSYDELLDATDIDAVCIPLPPSLHAEWTIKAAERGKHVLCEKPLAINLAEAQSMADACREHGVQLMDGVMWVHHDRTPAMHQLIHAGPLGALRRITSAFCFNGKSMHADNIRLVRELGAERWVTWGGIARGPRSGRSATCRSACSRRPVMCGTSTSIFRRCCGSAASAWPRSTAASI